MPDVVEKVCRRCRTPFTTTTPTEYCTPECWLAAKATRSKVNRARRLGLAS